MPDPIQVLSEWVAVTERKYGRVRLTQTVTAEQAEAALAQVEALVEAVREIAENERWVQAGPLIDKARFALAPFKDNP